MEGIIPVALFETLLDIENCLAWDASPYDDEAHPGPMGDLLSSQLIYE